MCSGLREEKIASAFAAIVVVAVGLAFWVPGLSRTGAFPVPLDDVYIHFDFARSAALGHPFSWLPGNGYSSGGTSLTYPLVLAPAWLLGFRGARLAWFSAALACVCLYDLCRSLRAVAPRSRVSSFVAPLLLLSVPLLDWSFYSGMETALFAAILGRSLLAARRAMTIEPALRASAQLHAGVWSALLIATRPEAAALVFPLGVAITYGARSLGTIPSLARTMGPTGFFLGVQAAVNLAFTSELGQAGAIRKLVGTNPYMSPIEAAIEVIKNLAVLRTQAFDTSLGGAPYSYAAPLLALVAVLSKKTRPLAVPLLMAAIGMMLLVSLNTTARYQNFRYAAPSLVMLLLAAALGAAVLLEKGRAFFAAGSALALVVIIAPARHFPRQIDHFTRASANIEGQQATVGRKLAALEPKPHRVFLNDAGAIPYFSDLPALDGLGLGGYYDLPFARASVHGVPAVIELIERLPVEERPDLLAIYTSWWPELAKSFGHKLFDVTIEDNVVCGSPEKAVYAADWSKLAPRDEHRVGVVDEIDVADLVSEREHRYTFPRPHGGWVIGATLRDGEGDERFDAGRIITQGESETFVLGEHVAKGQATLTLRTDGRGVIHVEVTRSGGSVSKQDVKLSPRSEAEWLEVDVLLPDVSRGDLIKITAKEGAFRSFHGWLVQL